MTEFYWIMLCRKCKKSDVRIVKEEGKYSVKCAACGTRIAWISKPQEIKVEEVKP
jgi:uncharacterized Zn finger protein